ncbi:MAG: flagellar biosynthetic protein FliR [Bryobacteraceae bacterium]
MTLGLPLSTMYAFLLVLARVSGFVMFLPVPAFRAAADGIRVVFALVLTFALFPAWPNIQNTMMPLSQLVVWAAAEAGFGLAAGIATAFLTETFQLAMQILGLQAGYGYASTIDPTSQADAGVLQVMSMLVTGLLFFSTGLDRALLRMLAKSFEAFPAGSWTPAARNLDGIVQLGSGMFSLGLRTAMPVVAFLLLIDVALALLGRMQQQLQLLSLAFPAKMLAALAGLALLAPIMAKMFESASSHMMEALARLILR